MIMIESITHESHLFNYSFIDLQMFLGLQVKIIAKASKVLL